MADILFSIIVPMYNAEHTIKKCIESVLYQSEKNYELLIIDDGSTDNSNQVAEKAIHGSCAQIISVKNTGVSNARNVGLNNAKGRYVLFLDADDWFPQNTLDCYKKYIDKYNLPELLLAGFYRNYPQRESEFRLDTPKERGTLVYNQEKKEFDLMNPRFLGCVWGKCYRRDTIGNLRFDVELSLCEDAEFNFRLVSNVSCCVYIDQCLYHYLYSESSTIRRFNQDYIEKYITALETIEKSINFDERQCFELFVCNVFNIICFNVICSPMNPLAVYAKIKELRKLMKRDVFTGVFGNVNMNKLPMKHRIVIFFAKQKIAGAIYIISLGIQIIKRFLY